MPAIKAMKPSVSKLSRRPGIKPRPFSWQWMFLIYIRRNYNNLVIRIKVLLYNKIPIIARKLRVSMNGWNGPVGQTIKCILMEFSTNMPSAEADTFCPKIISTPAPPFGNELRGTIFATEAISIPSIPRNLMMYQLV
jgi:hypothetical protein